MQVEDMRAIPVDRIVDFDIYNPPGGEDLHAAWLNLQTLESPDLVWTPRNGGHWIATRCELLRQVYADHERFSARSVIVPRPENYDQLPHTLDPPSHRPFRALLNSGLGPKAVLRLTTQIRNRAIELIEAIRPLGGCDFTTAYAAVFPIKTFLELVDLPAADAAVLKRWSDAMVRPDGSMSMDEALQKFRDYLDPWIEARLGKPGDDLLSIIINGRVDGRQLTREEARRMVSTVLAGGLDTVANALGFIMLFLARNPGRRRELLLDPKLIPAAVDELLRRFPIVTLGREVRRDVVDDGVEMKRGEMVMAPTLLGGLDDRVNPRPLEVDFHRVASEDVTFGSGPHKCPGMFLALAELRITLEEWLKRIPDFEIAPGKDVRFVSGIVGAVGTLPLIWQVDGAV